DFTLVTGVDKTLQAVRTAIARLDCERVHAVVAPIAAAGKLGDRHDLDRSDTKLLKLIEVWNNAVESPLRRERPNVKFVDEVILERQAGPAVVSPIERPSIDDLGGPVDTLRLEP